MTDSKTKYPAHEWISKHNSLREFDGKYLDAVLDLEFNQLLAENERYKRVLEDIVKQLNSRSLLAATEFAEHRDYFQDGLSAGLNEARILIEQALKGEVGVE